MPSTRNILTIAARPVHRAAPIPLDFAFFAQPATAVSAQLLGTIMARRIDGTLRRARVVEVEAYVGPNDLASHASKGRTGRTEVMFGPAGRGDGHFLFRGPRVV